MSNYYHRPEFFTVAGVYETAYRLLRELWEPQFRALKADRKRALRQLRENHPKAYRNAFHSFWENKRDIQRRRRLKALWEEEQREEERKTHQQWSYTRLFLPILVRSICING